MTTLMPLEPDARSVEHLALTLRRLDEAHRRYRVHAAKIIDVGATELTALVAIGDDPGITPSALARELALSSGATTAVIDRLERSGHIYRADNPADRRSLHLLLTNEGKSALQALATAYRYLLSTTGTDATITDALPQLDSITYALNTAAREQDTTPITELLGTHPAHAA